MANTIELANKFLPIIDEVYKAASFSSGLDTPQMPGYFSSVNKIKVLKVSTTGLGNYSRTTGYPKGDVSATWEEMTLTQERGKEINVDRMDNEETLGLTFGNVVGNFVKLHVAPEIDAYRFAKYATLAGSKQSAALTKDTIIPAIDEAIKELDSKEVPADGRILYVSSNLKPVLNIALARQWGSDGAVNNVLSNYNGIPIVYVSPGRFYSQITLNDGTTNWGYVKTAGTGKDLNFLLIKTDAVLQGAKFALPKIFTPDENQTIDMWKFQYRNYHDAFVYDNKTDGIYAHMGV